MRLNDKCCSEPPQGRNVKKGEMWVKTVNEVEPCSYVIEVCGGEKCVDDSRREVGEAFKILEEEMKGKCLVYSEDWWSYEYCWPGKVKQFHLKVSTCEESKRRATTTIFKRVIRMRWYGSLRLHAHAALVVTQF